MFLPANFPCTRNFFRSLPLKEEEKKENKTMSIPWKLVLDYCDQLCVSYARREYKKKAKRCCPPDPLGACPRSPSFSILQNLQNPVSVSTVPTNGDLNPYALIFVPEKLHLPKHVTSLFSPGDLLMSNFNNSSNQSATGTTIVQLKPGGTSVSTFFTSSLLGLTGAMNITPRGIIILGNIPQIPGMSGSTGTGAIQFINADGTLLYTLVDCAVTSPWGSYWFQDSDCADSGILFVSNGLVGNVVRIPVQFNFQKCPPKVTIGQIQQVACGYMARADPVATVIGVSGLVYDCKKDILYVASQGDNTIFGVKDPLGKPKKGTGKVIYTDSVNLHGPTMLIAAPNGNLITSNDDSVNLPVSTPSAYVEFTKQGQFVAQISVDPSTGGAFGLALSCTKKFGLRFAAVDDNVPTVTLWNVT